MGNNEREDCSFYSLNHFIKEEKALEDDSDQNSPLQFYDVTIKEEQSSDIDADDVSCGAVELSPGRVRASQCTRDMITKENNSVSLITASARISGQLKQPGPKRKADELVDRIARRKLDPFIKRIRDPYDSYGMHIAETLRSLSPNMVVYCKKVINEAVFLAETNNLKITSQVVSDKNIKSNFLSNS